MNRFLHSAAKWLCCAAFTAPVLAENILNTSTTLLVGDYVFQECKGGRTDVDVDSQSPEARRRIFMDGSMLRMTAGRYQAEVFRTKIPSDDVLREKLKSRNLQTEYTYEIVEASASNLKILETAISSTRKSWVIIPGHLGIPLPGYDFSHAAKRSYNFAVSDTELLLTSALYVKRAREKEWEGPYLKQCRYERL